MKVTLQTFGGHVGRRKPARVFDSAALNPTERSELATLAAAATAAAVPDPLQRHEAPDAMSYRITVDDGDSIATLQSSDTTMSPEFARLLEWLESHPGR